MVFFTLSYPLCFYYSVVCWFILQEHLFLFWFLFVCLHFFDKIDYSVIQILLIMFPKYKYHVFLSASLRFFSFSLGFLLFVFSSQIRNLWLLLADLKIHSVPNLFSYVSITFYKVMKRSLIVLWTVPPFLGFPPYFFWMFISLLWLHYSPRLLFCQVLFKNIFIMSCRWSHSL